MLLVATLAAALAADVVWLEPPDEVQRATVLAAAGGQELDLMAFRGAATRFGPADERALRDLSSALADVRSYETQLDGELLIMRDLEGPIADVGVVRDEADRSALFAALAYQGFAVDRFFGEQLSSATEAAAYRLDLNGLTVERPWADAVALEPDRQVSAYDIAEAPQRIAYAGARAVVNEVLPGSVRPPDDTEGQLFIDGREVAASASGDVKLPPGRHLAHMQRDGVILARWDLRLAPGQQEVLDVALDDAAWSAFLAGLGEASSVPEPLQASVAALGGEVWLARSGTRAAEVWSITSDGVAPVAIEAPRGKATPGGAGSRPTLEVAVLGGWAGSPDFYYQDPRLPAESATVNAPSVAASVGTSGHIGPVRLGAGLDAWLPLGANHAARTGDSTVRLRPVPYVLAGIGPASVAVGYALPYHPAVGLRGALPLPGPLELRWIGWFGLPGTRERDGAQPYELHVLGLAGAGLGARF